MACRRSGVQFSLAPQSGRSPPPSGGGDLRVAAGCRTGGRAFTVSRRPGCALRHSVGMLGSRLSLDAMPPGSPGFPLRSRAARALRAGRGPRAAGPADDRMVNSGARGVGSRLGFARGPHRLLTGSSPAPHGSSPASRSGRGTPRPSARRVRRAWRGLAGRCGAVGGPFARRVGRERSTGWRRRRAGGPDPVGGPWQNRTAPPGEERSRCPRASLGRPRACPPPLPRAPPGG